MGRLSHAVAALALPLVIAGCGDPLVVLGDTPGLMRIVLGIGDSIGTRVDTSAVRTRLREPRAVAFAPELGSFYATDRGASRTVSGVTTPVGRIFSVTSGGRARLELDAGGCLIGTCILDPVAMVRHNGTLIIADVAGNRIVQYTPGGGITVLAGNGTAATSADGAVAATSPVFQPAGVAVAPDGRILFSEGPANRVRAIGPDGRLTTVAGSGASTTGGDGGAAVNAGVVQPAGLLYIDDVLYIAEYGAGNVRAVNADGTISTVAGVGGQGFSGDGGPAVEAALNRPFALAAAENGRTLFITDQGNNRVRAVDLVTGIIRTFAGTGGTRWTGSRGSAGETSLDAPYGLAVGSSFLFIVDRGHAVIWRTAVDFN